MISFDHRDTSKKTGDHPWFDQTVESMPEADIEIKSLKLGDVEWDGLNGTHHVMEIKHTGDLIRSFGDRHIQDQVDRMVVVAEQDDKIQNHLLVAGQLRCTPQGTTSTDNNKKWNYPYAIWGPYLMGVQGLGFAVHRCELKDFGMYFRSIYRTTTTKPSRISRRRKATLVSRQAQALTALAPSLTIPVLERAIKQLGFYYFVDPLAVVEDFAEVEGIGPVGANELYENLNKGRKW